MRATKAGTMFVAYTNSSSESKKTTSTIPEQYKEFRDVFKKKNADILPEHRPYDCAIDL